MSATPCEQSGRDLRYGARRSAASVRDAWRRCQHTSPLINPHIPAEDFARQLGAAEFESLTDTSAATRRVALAVVLIDGILVMRTSLGVTRSDALVRELALFVRRILRGVDAVTVRGDELYLLLDASSSFALSVGERILAGVRAHSFTAGGSGSATRISLSIGIASAPEHGTSHISLVTAARQALRFGSEDGVAAAFSADEQTLNLNRFMGRGERLSSLIDTLDNMVRGAGHVVAVMGESGVGCSTLVRTLEPEIRLRGGSLVTGTCYKSLLPSPYSLWIDVLRAVRRLPVKTTRQWRDLPLLDASLERVADSAQVGSSKTRLLEEVADFFRLAAQQRPLVLLLENIQWCDDASWDALEYLSTQLERERILIVLTVQTGGASDVALERWSRIASRPRHTEIRLNYLTRDDVKRWLEATLRTVEVSREVMSYVYRLSEGRPLVLAHLLRDLEESGHLVRAGEVWHWSAVHDLPPISAFDDLVARRLSRLAPGPREVLEVAAVLVRDADETFLLGEGAARRRGDIRLLVDGGFLRPTFDRARAAYVIAHAELARIVQSRLSAARLAEVHQRVARALATEPGANASEIAEHFENGGNNTLAHRYALTAADHALSMHEPGAIATLLGAAERTAPTEAALAEVRVRLVPVAQVAGRLEEAEAHCERALAWYAAQGEYAKALHLKSMRVRLRMQRGQAASDTLEALLALEREAADAGADSERAAILLLMAQTHWRLGDLRAAQRVAAECLEIAERSDDSMLLADSCNRLAVTIQLENAPRARELFVRALDLATVAGDAFRRVRSLNNIGVLELITNNWEEAKRMLALAADQARTASLPESWGRAELNLGVLAGRMGDHETAQRALAEALRLTSVVQNSEEQLYATYNLAHLDRERLRFREAADTYSLVTELSARIGQVEVQAGAFAGLGLCRFLTGDLPGARDACHRALPLIERLHEWFQGRELVEALRIHLALEDNDLEGASAVFAHGLAAAGPSDVYGAAWLTAEFGKTFQTHLPDEVERAVKEYAQHPEVLGNPAMRNRLSVLKLDTTGRIDG